MIPRWSPEGLALALVISWMTYFVALDVMNRVFRGNAETARLWRPAGTLVGGTGVWAITFVDLNAMQLPVPVGYDYWLTLASWSCSLLICWVMLGLVAPQRKPWTAYAGGSLLTGLAVVGMLYLAVASMRMDPAPTWDLHRLPLAAGLLLLVSALSIGMLRSDWWCQRVSLPGQVAAAMAVGSGSVAMQWACFDVLTFSATARSGALGHLSGHGLTALAAAGAIAMLVLLMMAAFGDSRFAHSARHWASSLEKANEELEAHMMRDTLTGLPNRPVFEDRLGQAVARADRHAQRLAVLFFDLDGFKAINDSYGYATGDQVLREVSARLLAACRKADTVARIGADEFLILLDQAEDTAVTMLTAQRLIDEVGSMVTVDGHEVPLSCSIGVAFFPDHGPQADLVVNANAAMRAAKLAGGGSAFVFEEHMDARAREQLELRGELSRAIEQGGLTLHYQPKVDARTGELLGVEALARWIHPTLGPVSPGVFIPLAERFGLIGALGRWVVEEACRQIAQWSSEGLSMRVAVNLSAHQLRDGRFAAYVEQMLARHGISPSSLMMEITESVAMEDTALTLQALDGLASLGLKLSIDDFGTGHSSLSYLRRLPARQLKIDRSFIKDVEDSDDARAIVQGVINLSHALGLHVVAEGVETPGQRQLLVQLGCDQIQGFLFAKPAPAAMLLQWARGEGRPDLISFPEDVYQAVPVA